MVEFHQAGSATNRATQSSFYVKGVIMKEKLLWPLKELQEGVKLYHQES